jgi:hypothetical protein
MKPTIRTFIKWNTRNLFITVIFFAILSIISGYYLRSYLMDTFLPPSRLDRTRAFANENLTDITGDLSEVKPTYMSKGFYIDTMFNAYFTDSYMQDLRHIFKIEPEKLYRSQKYYDAVFKTTTGEIEISEAKTENSFKYYVAEVDDVLVFVKLKHDKEVNEKTVLKGTLMPLDKTFIYKIRLELKDQFDTSKLFMYELDTIMSYKNMIQPIMAVFYVPFVIFLFLLIKLIIYKSNYKLHPTYRQLRRFAGPMEENEAYINRELASDTMKYVNNYEIIHNISYEMEHWAILKRAFKSKILDLDRDDKDVRETTKWKRKGK